MKDVDMGGSSITARIKDNVLTLNGTILDKKVVLDGFFGLSVPYLWRGRLSFDKGRFEPFLKILYKDLPEDVTFLSTGVFTGEGSINEPGKMNLSLNFSEVSASIMGRKLSNAGDITLAYKDGRLDIKSLRLKGDSISIEMSGGAEGLEQIDASLKVNTALGPLKSFMKDSVDYLDGNAQADLRIRGEVAAPAVFGGIKVLDAGIKLKEFQQRLDRINAEIKLDGENFNITRLDADLGGGIIKAKGKGGFKGFVLDNYAIGVNAEGVRLKYPEGVSSTVDADLNIEGIGNSRSISGEVTVKKARYAERIDWKSWLVKIQRKKPVVAAVRGRAPLGNTAMNIHVVAAESIRIDNNVAKVPVSSDIYLRGTIDNPAVLGRLESNGGVVYFRNNEFKLVNGVAEFVDPRRINPMVDLQAETKVKEYLISLSVSGTVDKVQVALSSDPPLEDEDILSLLTLGRTSEGLKGHEAVITTGEATSFVTGQIQDAVESRLRKITGFDRFQIDPYLASSGASSGPRLTIGKSLFSDKLYITYSSNLGTSEDQFVRLEYIFNKNFSAVAERDELGHVGADFKFRFEFK
jgi:translocation and assembly module TamB